jgi:hypothetical protein
MNERKMIRKYFDGRFRRAKSSERAEAMPAAIITAIVSSLLLLGIASAVSLVVQNKADSEGNVNLTTVASNIDVSLRSDVTNASYITASAKLKQPAGSTLTPTDLTLSGVNMHIPSSTGECKVIRWSINGTTATRDLTIYPTTATTSAAVKCDETTTPVAKRTKVFSDSVNVKAPFKFYNQVGRELNFTHATASLKTVNDAYTAKVAGRNPAKLTDAELNELNKLLTSSSFDVGFVDPAACVMNAAKVNSVCPDPEASTVTAAWNSLKIAKVSVVFEMSSDSGEAIKRDIEQNSSVPLYANAAEAQGAVAAAETDLKPDVSIPGVPANITLGSPYMVTWTPGGDCPTNMTKTYKLYENGLLVNTTATTSFTKSHTNSADDTVNYIVQIECVRGALVISSDMSVPASAKVIPAVPALVINQQPAAANAALNSPIVSTATCLYGTSPRYNLIQTATTYGAAGSISNLTSVNRPINTGLPVVEGARYTYRVDAWCVNTFATESPKTNRSTNSFVTLINIPSVAPVWTAPSPINGSMKQPTSNNLAWNAATCATGTSVQYYMGKNMDSGFPLVPVATIANWGGARVLTTWETEGNRIGYQVQGRCLGSAGVTSNPTNPNNLTFTTLVNTPSMPTFTYPAKNALDVPTNTTITWSPVTCATGTTVQYQLEKEYDAGAALAPTQILEAWTGATSTAVSNGPGSRVGYALSARCVGPNDISTVTTEDTLTYTTLVNAPSAPVFTSPANNATLVATNAAITWSSVTCDTGTTAKYYMTKNIDANVTMATPTVIDDWTIDTSAISGNTEGSIVGYTVAARCEGPNAYSADSATSTLKYTTVINAPAATVFTSPAEGQTGVSTTVTVRWSAVTCAPGTTTRYYSTLNVKNGAAITPVVLDSWTTDTSYVSNNFEGSTVGYTVAARCAGPNINSASTPNDTVKYTTVIYAPGAATATHNGGTSLYWTAGAKACAAGTTLENRVYQSKDDNNTVALYAAWGVTSPEAVPAATTPGYPQWAAIQSRCNGPNADSAVVTSNTEKWIRSIVINFSASMDWRRLNVSANCPAGTTLGTFYAYVASQGWGGTRTNPPTILTDEGDTIMGSMAGTGGNSGWVTMSTTQNTGWIATTANWGFSGQAGWGSRVTGNDMVGTYWNAGGWGYWAYYWYGRCSTAYVVVGDKGFGADPNGSSIPNRGDPFTRYNAALNGQSYTQAGVDAIA